MPMTFANFTAGKRLDDEALMAEALRAAEHAKSNGDLPVGAVLAWPGGFLAEGDTTYSERDPTAHACLNVLRKAAQTTRVRLSEAVLYTTLEPCPLCAAAAEACGIGEVVFGAYDRVNGYWSGKRPDSGLVNKGGVLGEECRAVLPFAFKEHTTGAIDG